LAIGLIGFGIDPERSGSAQKQQEKQNMFTLKLFRRNPSGQMVHIVIQCASVQVMEIGKKALELWAFKSGDLCGADYLTFYVGEPEEPMEAYGRDDLHLATGPNSWWGWGLLENWEGNTSEHYRPASFG
jgi:hypothetical protein